MLTIKKITFYYIFFKQFDDINFIEFSFQKIQMFLILIFVHFTMNVVVGLNDECHST